MTEIVPEIKHKSILDRVIDAVLGGNHSKIDVEDFLQDAAESNAHRTNGEALDWRHSVVDLLKLLDLPSDAESRERLAYCLGYPSDAFRMGDRTADAVLNVWLHRKLLQELGKRGGLIPHAWL